MNNNQLGEILSRFTKDIIYWPPEILHRKYHYIDSEKEKEDVFVITILHQNKEAFKARIRETIVDDWLTKERFGPIAHRCIVVLQQFNNLKDWQLKLIDLLKSYI